MQSIPINTYDSPTAVLELIHRLKVKDVMTADIHSIGPTATMREVRNTLKENSITGMPVVADTRILGIVSMEDVLQALDSGSIDETVQQHMSKKLIVLEDDMPVFFAISYFGRYSYRRFPVINKHSQLVGIVTSRDITTKLLIEANNEIERLERETGTTPAETYTGQIERWFKVYRYDFENAGYASTEIKKILKTRSIDSKTARRIAISAYELEMNLVVHSNGGSIHFLMDDNQVLVQADDTGPGIEDVKAALTEGFTTATEWIRSLGFGAGMGLPNVQRVSDEFSITSEPNRGTHAKSIIQLSNQDTRSTR